jgi:hypothetical protein
VYSLERQHRKPEARVKRTSHRKGDCAELGDLTERAGALVVFARDVDTATAVSPMNQPRDRLIPDQGAEVIRLGLGSPRRLFVPARDLDYSDR